MNRERERRLQRVADLMKRKLDQRVAELAEARGAEAQAREQLVEFQAKLRQATEQTLSTVLSGADADEWSVQHNWRVSLGQHVELADQQLKIAIEGVEAARQAVLAARSEMNRIEALIQRLAQAREQEEARAERKTEDDFAVTRAAGAQAASKHQG